MIVLAANNEKLSILTAEQKQAAMEIINSTTEINKLVSTLKNATHYEQIIIDISIFEDSEPEIIKALYLLKSMNSTKIIIIAQGKSVGDIFLSELVSICIYDFVTSWTSETVLSEMQACVDGRTLQDVAHYIIKTVDKKSKFKLTNTKAKEPVYIQLVGTVNRIGTTTQAVRLAKGLVALGYSACYLECNSSGHLKIMSEVFSEAQAVDEVTISYLELHMLYSKRQAMDYDYVVCDFGSYEACDFTVLSATAKTIVVAGSTAWEMVKLPTIMENLNAYADVSYLFSFTCKSDETDILDFVGDKWCKTHFAEYCPDMFSDVTEAENVFYKKLIFGDSKGFNLLGKIRKNQ